MFVDKKKFESYFVRKIDSGNVHDRAEFHVFSGNLVLSSTKHVEEKIEFPMCSAS